MNDFSNTANGLILYPSLIAILTTKLSSEVDYKVYFMRRSFL